MTHKIISGERVLAKADFETAVRRAARGLHEAGAKPGDCVALFLRNDFPFLVASHAAIRLGAYVVPVNWHFKADEVAYVLGDCGARVLVVHADLWSQIAEGVPDDVIVLVVPTPPELVAAYDIAPEAARVPAA